MTLKFDIGYEILGNFEPGMDLVLFYNLFQGFLTSQLANLTVVNSRTTCGY